MHHLIMKQKQPDSAQKLKPEICGVIGDRNEHCVLGHLKDTGFCISFFEDAVSSLPRNDLGPTAVHSVGEGQDCTRTSFGACYCYQSQRNDSNPPGVQELGFFLPYAGGEEELPVFFPSPCSPGQRILPEELLC